MTTPKPATIHDIARLAGVSSATVSRVLSNSGYPVSAKLREKILRTAKEVHYVPNLLGKQLKTNINTTIGVIVPSITNPFYSSVLLGIEETARKNNYNVLLCNSMHDPVLEETYLRTTFEKQIRGLILSSITEDKKAIQDYIRMGQRIIAIDQKIDDAGISQVEFDYHKGGLLATRHLIANGHRRIAFVTAPLDRPSRIGIHSGYLEAMREAGLELLVKETARDHKYDGIYEFENGKALTSMLLEEEDKPTAVFACNDMTAFGVIHQLDASGFRVPDDISVIGFDGIDFGEIVRPALTTIKQPNAEMGRLACSMLMEAMQSDGFEPVHLLLQPKLIERQSVAPIAIEA
ncbi:LacI family DNA-binding transcriptional regulator [Paenibacillus aurantius]|uniref:LacI family DNA-binding transcriptional regulator n=1 Tax=Paenibacillus aurantius TaxID=2918900 RepID=A0AA96LDX4_9BACL|nr:LacI family DNA-binding transcriptional regulator [Paenibacillus aurantius]WJH34676.1 LacI family transcriptional regulator [Paenibacillus sp. CC-CFT747]WNQ09887.1 LacI family DNA-binding transcriptional regulator [Paenibacillus aurantius]